MSYPSVSNTFANGQVSDANEVNENFQDLVDAASDGLKDYNIAGLECDSIAQSSASSYIDTTAGILGATTVKADNLTPLNPYGIISVAYETTFSNKLNQTGNIYNTPNAAATGEKNIRYIDENGRIHKGWGSKYLLPTTVSLTLAGVSGATTIDVVIQRLGNLVVIQVPVTVGLVGDGTNNYYWLTGLPADLTPSDFYDTACGLVVENGTSVPINTSAVITTSGMIELETIDVSGSHLTSNLYGWSTTGPRNIRRGGTIVYMI